MLETFDPRIFKVAMVEAVQPKGDGAQKVRRLMRKAGMVRSVNVTVPFSDVWVRPGLEEVPISGVVYPKRVTYTETKVSVSAENLGSALRRALGRRE